MNQVAPILRAHSETLLQALARHALDVWRDQEFRTTLRQEAWSFVSNVGAAARDASRRHS